MSYMTDAQSLPAQSPQRSADAIIGANIHQLMWARQESQTAVAPEWGMDQTTLSLKLRGKRPWRADEIVAAAERYSVSVAALFAETRPKDYRSEGSFAKITDIRAPRSPQSGPAPVARSGGRGDRIAPVVVLSMRPGKAGKTAV